MSHHVFVYSSRRERADATCCKKLFSRLCLCDELHVQLRKKEAMLLPIPEINGSPGKDNFIVTPALYLHL